MCPFPSFCMSPFELQDKHISYLWCGGGGGDEFIGATIGNRISSLSNQDNAARVLMHGVSGGGGSSGSFPT